MEDNVHNCADEDLGSMLHRLFTEQPDAVDVEIQHPTEGSQVITREDFYKTVENLGKAAKMSPAERLMARKQTERLRKNMQTRFRTALIGAEVAEIDVVDGQFGYNVNGDKLPVDGMTFVRKEDYPSGTELLEREIGAFVAESGENQPLRVIKANVPPAGGVANNACS